MPSVHPEHWLARIARQSQLDGADSVAVDSRKPISDIWQDVCRACNLAEGELAHHVAAALRLQEADLASAAAAALKLLPKKLAQRCLVFPVRQDDRTVVVATSNPVDLEVEQAIAFSSGRSVSFEVAAPGALAEAIELHYSAERDIESFLRGMGVDVTRGVSVEERSEPESVSDAEAESEPIVQLTNVILAEAVRKRASDIHVEPTPHGGVVRLRVDGVLQHYMQMPMPALHRVISRVKVLGNSTSPTACARRTAASVSGSKAASTTCGCLPCRRRMPRRPSSVSSTRRAFNGCLIWRCPRANWRGFAACWPTARGSCW